LEVPFSSWRSAMAPTIASAYLSNRSRRKTGVAVRVSLAASINLLVCALGGIVSGKLLDRIAPMWIATTGALVGAAGLFLCTRASSPLCEG